MVVGLTWATVSKVCQPEVPLQEAGGHRSVQFEETRRGFPVFRSTIVAGNHSTAPEFPVAKVETRVARGRVSILALDDESHPLGFGSGFVTEDGMHVATALPLVKGASAVQIWFDGRPHTLAQDVMVNETLDLAVLGLADPKAGILWSSARISAGVELYVAGHALQPLPIVAQVTGIDHEGKLFVLDGALPSSFLGAAVVDSSGALCGMITQLETGRFLGSAEFQKHVTEGKPQPIATLEAFDSEPLPKPVTVDSAEIEDGQLVMQMRNTSGTTIHHAVIYVQYHELPAAANELESLQAQVADLAVEVCDLELEQPQSERCVLQKSLLRKVTAQLEAQRRLAAEAMQEARKQVRHTDVLALNAELPHSIPQQVMLTVNAASNWGAVVTVLDAVD